MKSISSKIEETFGSSLSCATFLYGQFPPSNAELELTLDSMGIPPKIYQDAYYSNEKDVPPRPREYAGREFKLQSNTTPFLPDFDPSGDGTSTLWVQKPNRKPLPSIRVWEILQPPPSRAETDQWLVGLQAVKRDKIAEVSEEQLLSQVLRLGERRIKCMCLLYLLNRLKGLLRGIGMVSNIPNAGSRPLLSMKRST